MAAARWQVLSAIFPSPDAPAEDLAAFAEYARERTAYFGRVLASALAVAEVAWWPVNWFELHGDPATFRVFSLWRTSVTLVLCATWVTLRSRRAQEHAAAIATANVAAFAALTGALLTNVGGAGHPILYAHYLIPNATVLVLLPPGKRLIAVGTVVAASLASALASAPDVVDMPTFRVFVGLLLGCSFIPIGMGHFGYLIVRENFLQHRALSRTTRELAALNGELEARVAARTEELRALAAHLAGVLENERARIARDIHDELGQSLTAMRLEIDDASHSLAPSGALRDAIDRIARLLDATLGTSRRILTELRPRVLDDFGLRAAIEWLAGEFRARHACACELSIDPDLDVDSERATALFRIVQECLNNVARHAGAARVEILLTRDDRLLRLMVRDDGRGLGAGPVRAGAMGLLGMRERAWQFDGRVALSSEPGSGTTVDVEIPLQPACAGRREELTS
jgi:signal transduction histidine kinase